MLSAEERQRVINALNFDPDAANIVSLVEQLQTSAELHQFVLNYNPNDGLRPLRSIVANPACDLGTALCIYWLLGDFAIDRELSRDKEDPDWDGVSLVEEIETRVGKGFYTNQRFRFVPYEFYDWSPAALKRLELRSGGTLPFPKIMLQPSPGENVQQEWLV